MTSAGDVARLLDTTGYLADDELATVTYLALSMQRPLLAGGRARHRQDRVGRGARREPRAAAGPAAVLRGHRRDPGALRLGLPAPDPAPARARGRRRRVPTSRRPRRACTTSGSCWPGRCWPRSSRARPLLLVDEVDRADDEFEAFLLEVLSTWQVSIPELGTVKAATPPIVVLTSNRTRELHDALKRRCLYHWIEHPGLERELQIVRSRAPEVSESLARQVVAVVQRIREVDLTKPSD